MATLSIYFNTIIFLLLSGIHFYWAMGGRWGSLNAVPTMDKTTEAVFKPSIIATLIVAFGLLILAFITYSNLYSMWIHPHRPRVLGETGQYLGLLNALIALLFLLRAVGDFRYVGFFKKVKNTNFAYYDRLYFTPLCLIISILQLIIYLK
jgi:Protein of unknown function (DUF3995)